MLLLYNRDVLNEFWMLNMKLRQWWLLANRTQSTIVSIIDQFEIITTILIFKNQFCFVIWVVNRWKNVLNNIKRPQLNFYCINHSPPFDPDFIIFDLSRIVHYFCIASDFHLFLLSLSIITSSLNFSCLIL